MSSTSMVRSPRPGETQTYMDTPHAQHRPGGFAALKSGRGQPTREAARAWALGRMSQCELGRRNKDGTEEWAADAGTRPLPTAMVMVTVAVVTRTVVRANERPRARAGRIVRQSREGVLKNRACVCRRQDGTRGSERHGRRPQLGRSGASESEWKPFDLLLDTPVSRRMLQTPTSSSAVYAFYLLSLRMDSRHTS